MNTIEDKAKIPKEILIKDLEEELYFDYKISRTITFVRSDDPDCEICKDDKVAEYVAPFLSSKAPLDKVQKLIFLKFGFIIENEVFEKHREHINCVFNTDDELKEIGIRDLELIEAEIPDVINEDKIIETQIRQLQALAISYRKEGETGGFLKCSSLLIKWVELKKKLKMEIKSGGSEHYKIADIINLGDPRGKEDGRKPIDIKAKAVNK